MTTGTRPGTNGAVRRRGPSAGVLLIGGLVVLAVLLGGARTLNAARTDALDPENSRANGARAAARVIDDLGVEVKVARGREALDSASVDSTTTVVVTSTGELGTSTLEHLDELLVTADAHVVYVEPGDVVAEHVGSRVPRRTDVRGSVRGTVTSGCSPVFAGLSLAVTRAETYGPDGCFVIDGGAVLVEPAPGVTFFGAGQVLENGRVTDSDNAAVALRLLGDADRLVWYVPTSTDLSSGELASDGALLPEWLGGWLWLFLLAGLTLALWLGRRLGPLAVEPLPVVVDAVETTAGSGRLLRRGGDRAHAASVLRAAARRRLGAQLQAHGADLRTLVAVAADRTGRPPDDLMNLLSPDSPAPQTDAALVRLGQELATLTEEERHA